MTIRYKLLKGLLNFCSTDNFRKTLMSVAQSPTGFCATNTHILAWTGDLAEEYTPTNRVDVDTALLQAAHGLKPSKLESVEMEVDFEPGEGSYPRCSRVVPNDDDLGETVYFQADYLIEIAKLAKAAAEKSETPVVGLRVGKPSRVAAFVAFGASAGGNHPNRAYGVIMPFGGITFPVPQVHPSKLAEAESAA